MAVVFNL